jgi:hypothetical protein
MNSSLLGTKYASNWDIVSSLTLSNVLKSTGSVNESDYTPLCLPKQVNQMEFMYFLISAIFESEKRNYGLRIAAPN